MRLLIQPQCSRGVNLSRNRRVEGFAVVSEDGMLANAAGVMPDSLKFEADQRFFERGLDSVDVVVRMVRVYIRRFGRWQLVSAQATRLQQPR